MYNVRVEFTRDNHIPCLLVLAFTLLLQNYIVITLNRARAFICFVTINA